MRHLFIAGLAAAMLVGCAESAANSAERFSGLSGEEAAAADSYGQALMNTCPTLKYVDRYKLLDAILVEDGQGYPADTYGWDEYAQFRFRIVGGRDDGHAVLYRIGRGDIPGVLGQKPAARRACDLRSADADRDWFKPLNTKVASSH